MPDDTYIFKFINLYNQSKKESGPHIYRAKLTQREVNKLFEIAPIIVPIETPIIVSASQLYLKYIRPNITIGITTYIAQIP